MDRLEPAEYVGSSVRDVVSSAMVMELVEWGERVRMTSRT